MVAKEDLNKEDTRNQKILLNTIRNDFIKQKERIIWYLYVKEVIRECTEVEFRETSCTIRFHCNDSIFLQKHQASQENLFEWTVNLSNSIDVNKCSFKTTKTTIEITFAIFEEKNWSSVIKSENCEKQTNIQKSYRSPSNSPSPPPKIKPLPSKIGFVGLANLGNTCYMNAALQFLVNATDFRDYFLVHKEKFQKELNVKNALGLNGKMAVQFAILMRELWTSENRHIVPHRLRDLICTKYSNFRGFEQQDTQEFMSSLISLVHEDLNRVLKKPFYEDSLECEDDSLINCANIANKSWERFLSRENSIIVDNFYGQFKSKLTCPECKRVSITFEPFSNLLIPVPMPKISANFLVSIGQKLSFVNLYLNEDEIIQNIYEKIKNKLGDFLCKKLNLYVIEKVSNNSTDNNYIGFKFDSYLDDLKKESKLPNIDRDKHFMIFEVDGECENDPVYEFKVEQVCKFPIVNDNITNQCSFCFKLSVDESNKSVFFPRCTKCYRSAYCNVDCQKNDWAKHSKSVCLKQQDRIGLPFVLTFKKSQLKSETFEQDFRKIILDNSTKSVDLKNFDITKNSSYDLDILDVSSVNSEKSNYIKFSQSSLINTIEKSNKKIFKIILKWNNLQDRSIKTNLNNINNLNQDSEESIVDLKDCLKLFTQPEKLTSENPWYCSKCKKHQEATKQMSLWKLPKYLIVTLKRFQASKAADLDMNNEAAKFMMMNSRFSYLLQNRVVINKLDHFVNFPLEGLNMSNYLVNKEKQNCVYDLCAVINHLGHSLAAGHYTTFARTHDKVDTTKDEISWRLFDDQDVIPIKECHQVKTKDAYVLLYRLRSKSEVIVDNDSKIESESNNPSSDSSSEDEFYDIESEESAELNNNIYTNLNEID